MLPILVVAFGCAQADPPAEGLTVTVLANEGVLLTHGDHQVLIDGLHREYKHYGVLPSEVRESLETAAPPFHGIDLVLVSHRHGDHVHPDAVARHLAHNPGATLVSSKQVVAEVREALGADHAALSRTEEVRWERGHSEARSWGDVSVQFLGLAHDGGQFADVQNLGHLVRLGGRSVLHVGDASPAPENFAPFDLPSQDLDLVLLPYWYLLTAQGAASAAATLPAKQTIAVHVPPRDITEVQRQLQQTMPEATLFPTMQSSHTVP